VESGRNSERLLGGHGAHPQDQAQVQTGLAGLRRFNQEKLKTIGEELASLLATAFVKEVQHPGWIANSVLVPKKEWKMEDVH
jgi:hypothetical protein